MPALGQDPPDLTFAAKQILAKFIVVINDPFPEGSQQVLRSLWCACNWGQLWYIYILIFQLMSVKPT